MENQSNTPPTQNHALIERVQRLLAEAIQVPPDMVTPDLAFGDLPQWDSLGHMEVMMRLEDQFGVEISADTIAELISIPDICKYLQEQGYDQYKQ
ncbi:MAG: acyl carrier protein [Anaerolineales bacterium]|nr:acyl carrier protein [Anaerolineales bacterium]